MTGMIDASARMTAGCVAALLFGLTSLDGLAASEPAAVKDLFDLYVLGARCEAAQFSWTEDDLLTVERLLETATLDFTDAERRDEWNDALQRARTIPQSEISEALCSDAQSALSGPSQ